MAVPGFQEIMFPLLKFLEDRKEHKGEEVQNHIEKFFILSNEEIRELLPSGRMPKIRNRVGWARTYLKKAGLLVYPRRGYMQITENGLSLLNENPKEINVNLLKRYPEFNEFRTLRHEKKEEKTFCESNQDPIELIEQAHEEITLGIAEQILEKVQECSWQFFEQLVLDLLLNMGYGGSKKEAAERIGRVGDEGIDGIIKEDKLGLDVIYIQAKRWKGTVGRPEIQKFVGALEHKRANKGIFITTGNFSNEAIDYPKNIGKKVILIDGKMLSELMIEHNVGVSTKNTYVIKDIDTDYFSED